MDRLQYLERFLDRVDFVENGRAGALSEDRILIDQYDPTYYSFISKQLKNKNARVRCETILLLASVRDSSALDDVRTLRSKDCDLISGACLAYLDAVKEADELVPTLLKTLRQKSGIEFQRAAAKIGSMGKPEDIPEIRKVYGMVDGDMRRQVGDAISSIADRDPDLRKKKQLLLSVPVFPDERKFVTFLDKSIEYLDVRYRKGVHPYGEISLKAYNNVAMSLKKMKSRMFNEYDNLQFYGEESRIGYDRLSELMAWTSSDLTSKKVDRSDSGRSGTVLCERCGNPMTLSDGQWECLECCIRHD